MLVKFSREHRGSRRPLLHRFNGRAVVANRPGRRAGGCRRSSASCRHAGRTRACPCTAVHTCHAMRPIHHRMAPPLRCMQIANLVSSAVTRRTGVLSRDMDSAGRCLPNFNACNVFAALNPESQVPGKVVLRILTPHRIQCRDKIGITNRLVPEGLGAGHQLLRLAAGAALLGHGPARGGALARVAPVGTVVAPARQQLPTSGPARRCLLIAAQIAVRRLQCDQTSVPHQLGKVVYVCWCLTCSQHMST